MKWVPNDRYTEEEDIGGHHGTLFILLSYIIITKLATTTLTSALHKAVPYNIVHAALAALQYFFVVGKPKKAGYVFSSLSDYQFAQMLLRSSLLHHSGKAMVLEQKVLNAVS